ncbi:MAG: alpha/beta fold hydrolase [Gemmatimonadaceae bacterium]
MHQPNARSTFVHRAAVLLSMAASVVLLAALPSRARTSVPPRVTPVADSFDVGMLHVERFGTRGHSPVIFVPALFCGSWQWNREIDALAKQYDVYAVTLPGFDGHAFAAAGDTTPGDLLPRAAADLSRLIHERHLEHPIVVGHSLGGTLAVLFGATHPDDAAAIIAVEGGYPIAPTAAERATRVEASAAPYDSATPATLDSVLRARMLRYVITSPADVDSVARYASRSDPAAIAAWLRGALSLDLTGQLAAIHAPLLEIVPFDSSIDPYQGFPTRAAKSEAYTKWLSHAHNGKLEMIVPSRHFVMFDQPAEFDRDLFAAIRRAGEVTRQRE